MAGIFLSHTRADPAKARGVVKALDRVCHQLLGSGHQQRREFWTGKRIGAQTSQVVIVFWSFHPQPSYHKIRKTLSAAAGKTHRKSFRTAKLTGNEVSGQTQNSGGGNAAEPPQVSNKNRAKDSLRFHGVILSKLFLIRRLLRRFGGCSVGAPRLGGSSLRVCVGQFAELDHRATGAIMTESKDHDVGYGKPPVNHQFQKGQSGNPGGRPRGSKSFKTILEEELGHTIPSSRKGDGGKISVKRALVRKAIQTGLTTGDLRPLEKFGALNEDDRPSNLAFTLCFDNEKQLTYQNGEVIHDHRLDRFKDIDGLDIDPW